HKLVLGAAGVSKTKAVNNIVEARFQQLEKRFTGHTAFAQCSLKNAPKLSLEQSVLIAQLLFFAERDRVIGLLAPGASRAVHAGRIVLPLQRLRRTEDRHTVTPAHFCFWSCVSGHP